MPPLKLSDLDQLVREGAVRLEITGGIPTWEASPSSRHQLVIDRIRASIAPLTDEDGRCECAHLSDVTIQFSDGSLKRPDIAIFCVEPPEQDEALTVIPQAVIEIISPGYEYKDIALNPHFYLSQGVEDVVVVEPRTGAVTHHQATAVASYHSPVRLELLSGCICLIP